MADDIEIDLNIGAQVFPDESTEDAIARIVAAEPGRHGLTLVGRQSRALLVAKGQLNELELHPDNYEATYNARVRELGGDPDEMMVGNKPRWTMDEDGNVKDHETEQVYPAVEPEGAEVAGGPEVVEEATSDDAEAPAAGAEHDRAAGVILAPGSTHTYFNQGKEIRVQVGSTVGPNHVGAVVGSALTPSGVGGTSPGDAPLQVRAVDGNEPVADQGAAGIEHGAVPGAEQTQCEQHDYPDDAVDDTPCRLCGLTFAEWCNS